MAEAERDDPRESDEESGESSAERTQPQQHRRAALMLAAGMFAIDELMGRKKREEAPIVVDANGQPVDIDADGIALDLTDPDGTDVSVTAPPLPRSRPLVATRRAGARGRRGR